MATDVPLTHNWAADTWDWPLEKNDGIVKVLNTPERFQVGLAVADFRPDEIKISIIGDDLVVQAKHEIRNDAHGTISREVNRTYKLPADIDKSSLKSHLNQHGILSINANKKK